MIKKTITNPEFLKLMHKNTTMDDDAVVVLKIELRRTKRGFKEKLLKMHTFADGLYDAMKSFGIDITEEQSEQK